MGLGLMERNQMNGWFNSPEPTIFLEHWLSNLSIGRHSCSQAAHVPQNKWGGAFLWTSEHMLDVGGRQTLFFILLESVAPQNGCKWRWRNDLWLISLGSLNIFTPDPSLLPPPSSHCKSHSSFMTKWVFVIQFTSPPGDRVFSMTGLMLRQWNPSELREQTACVRLIQQRKSLALV